MLSFIEAVAADPDSQAGILMEEFIREDPIFSILGFVNEATPVYTYSQVVKSSTAGMRGLNEELRGEPSRESDSYETFKLMSDLMQTDWQVAAIDPNRKAREELRKIRAFKDLWIRQFFNGSTSLNNREFDGLRSRVEKMPRQWLHNDPAGAPLSLRKLRQAILRTKSATAILVSADLLDWLSESSQSGVLKGTVFYKQDELGRLAMMYNGLPILPIARDEMDREMLPATEVSFDGTSIDNTSIYVVSCRDGGLQGINFQGPKGYGFNVVEQGLRGVYEQTLVEYRTGIVIEDKRSVTRLDGIKLAPVTT